MKISGIQIFWMMATFEMGMSILLTITPTIVEVKQDAWISSLLAGLISVGVAFVSTKVSLLYPNQTFIEYSQSILGKWLGRFIMVPYFIQWYTVLAIILRQAAELVQTTILQTTPLFPILLIMILLIMYVSYHGVESIARMSETLGPGVVIMVVIVLALSINNIEWKQMFPVVSDSGWMALIKGSFPPASFLSECVMMTMFTSFMAQPKKAPFYAMLGVGFSCVLFSLSTLMVILTIGSNMAAKMWYPFFEMARNISLVEFIENLDALVIVIWFSSVFIKLSLYFFMTCYGTAQYFHLKNWKWLIGIVAPIVVILAMVPRNVDEASVVYPKQFWLPYVFPINMIGIPILLWIVGMIRKKMKLNSGS
jgi:spore germination protein KB